MNPITIAGLVAFFGLLAGALIYILDKRLHQARAEGTMKGPVEVVSDLDRLVSNGVGFKWKGKVHVIKPMKNRTFLQMLNELARMDELHRNGIKDQKEILKAYARMFSVVCDTITLSDVHEMTHAQIKALFGEIMKCVMGEAQVKAEEKKTLPEAAAGIPFASAQGS